ncbi:hypothetical protein RFI_16141 [Reticulomyxa filosa]|uniref:Uncharacterized protein n=1 Tax=Reticulomyxa filosa TaxID=46433 RepID=X6N544_RETFI|nr:hypothetical protein RFI_16141 [Reticulomyxa filosa]|eukprot:ETO21063.1 hypothetical protein RFI_16141 [Reticulomyxa filosa]
MTFIRHKSYQVEAKIIENTTKMEKIICPLNPKKKKKLWGSYDIELPTLPASDMGCALFNNERNTLKRPQVKNNDTCLELTDGYVSKLGIAHGWNKVKHLSDWITLSSYTTNNIYD